MTSRTLSLLAATVASAALSLGCQTNNDQQPWAVIDIVNSNGRQAQINCQDRSDCRQLVAALAGKYQVTFLYPLGRKERQQKRYRGYQLGEQVVDRGPETLPALATSREKIFRAEVCMIITWGPEILRISGRIASKHFSLRVTRTDSCSEEQYLLWNLLAETDPELIDRIPIKRN